ncbi:MAG TPA: hypothetical protein VGB20_05320 [bacterium]
MDTEIVNDSIEVGAQFGTGGLRPEWFVWQGRRRVIRQVTCAWREPDGGVSHRCFAVTDGVMTYELKLDLRTLRWRLTRVSGV